jgi:cytochrome c-type biogenesis protein CcmH
MRYVWQIVLALVLLSPTVALAVQPDELLSDPKLEQRARNIASGLRCLVCQNQSIDDSDAPLAKDFRVLVRDRLKAGDSDEQVLRFVVSRYGDFILLKPPFNVQTVLLWTLPGLILLAAGGVILFNVRRQRTAAAVPKPLNEAETAALRDILEQRTP